MRGSLLLFVSCGPRVELIHVHSSIGGSPGSRECRVHAIRFPVDELSFDA